jgi:hypothetical protein
MERPQSGLADYYRELSDLFGVSLKVSNRYGGFQALRKKFRAMSGSPNVKSLKA